MSFTIQTGEMKFSPVKERLNYNNCGSIFDPTLKANCDLFKEYKIKCVLLCNNCNGVAFTCVQSAYNDILYLSCLLYDQKEEQPVTKDSKNATTVACPWRRMHKLMTWDIRRPLNARRVMASNPVLFMTSKRVLLSHCTYIMEYINI